MRSTRRRVVRTLLAASLGGAFLFTGCNDTLRTTSENGIITTSQSLLTAFFQALIAVASQNSA